MVSSLKLRIKAVVAVTVSIAAIVSALVAYNYIMSNNAKPVWLFRGAYAEYHGRASILIIPVDMRLKLKVLDFNSSKAKLLILLNLTSPITKRNVSETAWVDFRSDPWLIPGMNLNGPPKTSYLYLQGLGRRKCEVYNLYKENESITVYIDQETGWPLKIEMNLLMGNLSTPLKISLQLVKTNIPKLTNSSITTFEH